MFLQGPGQASLLWTVLLLQDVLGFCERPAWTRIAWDMTPEDLEQLTKEQSNCLLDPMCHICHSFSGLTLSKGCIETLYASCQVTLFLIAVLSLFYLLPKLKRTKDTKSSLTTIQTADILVATETHEEYTHSTDKMLYRLVTNTSKMMKYMKHMAHHHQKEVKHRKLNKKRKADEIDDEDDEQFFPVCPHNHSSSGDTTMHEI